MSAVLELAKALIQCPSITPDDAGCQAIIQSHLDKLGFRCEPMRFGNVDNLWARLGDYAPLVVLAGHIDVVPPGPASLWSSPPFQPTVRENYLYGRGATDMKGAVAAKIIAAEKFIANHPRFKGSLALLITSDEEGDASHGTRKVLAELKERNEIPDYCLIGEASSEKTVGDQIRIGRRGSLHGKLLVHGKQGHVAFPDLARNPIHQAMPALNEMAALVWDQGNDYFPPTSFQITHVHASAGAANVIPGSLEILFNFRFSTSSTVNEIKERSQAILYKHGLSFDLHWELGAEPFQTRRGKLIEITQKAIKEITGFDTHLSCGGGTSDGRFFAPLGTEVVELGVCNTTAHQIDECVKIQDLEKLADIYYQILVGLLQ